MMPEILPSGKRVNDPPEKSALKFRLALAARKHPVGVAFTIAAVLAAAFLWAVKSNSDHFARDDARLQQLAQAGLRHTAVQSGQRAQAVKLLCNVNDVVLRLVTQSSAQSKGTVAFIEGIERATGVKLHGRPLTKQLADQAKQVKPLRDAHCDAQVRNARLEFKRTLNIYLLTLPVRERARVSRELTPPEVK